MTKSVAAVAAKLGVDDDEAVLRFAARWRKFDAHLTALVRSGAADRAAREFAEALDAWCTNGVTAAEVWAVSPQYADAYLDNATRKATP